MLSILVISAISTCDPFLTIQNYLMKKQRELLKQLRITSYIRFMVNKYSLLFYSNTPRNVDQSVVFFSFSSFAYSLRTWA